MIVKSNSISKWSIRGRPTSSLQGESISSKALNLFNAYKNINLKSTSTSLNKIDRFEVKSREAKTFLGKSSFPYILNKSYNDPNLTTSVNTIENGNIDTSKSSNNIGKYRDEVRDIDLTQKEEQKIHLNYNKVSSKGRYIISERINEINNKSQCLHNRWNTTEDRKVHFNSENKSNTKGRRTIAYHSSNNNDFSMNKKSEIAKSYNKLEPSLKISEIGINKGYTTENTK